jgi:hypothetical protein
MIATSRQPDQPRQLAYEKIPDGNGQCPLCRGTGKVRRNHDNQDTTCMNCLDRAMFSSRGALGYVRLDKRGRPCIHVWTPQHVSGCYARYRCEFCGSSYEHDSSD